MSRIDELLKAVIEAEDEVRAELTRLYPAGRTIRVRLRLGVKEGTATVLHVIGGREGLLRVKLDTGYDTTLPLRKVLKDGSDD